MLAAAGCCWLLRVLLISCITHHVHDRGIRHAGRFTTPDHRSCKTCTLYALHIYARIFTHAEHDPLRNYNYTLKTPISPPHPFHFQQTLSRTSKEPPQPTALKLPCDDEMTQAATLRPSPFAFTLPLHPPRLAGPETLAWAPDNNPARRLPEHSLARRADAVLYCT